LFPRESDGPLLDDQTSRERRGKTGWYVCQGAAIRHGSRGSRRTARRPQVGLDGRGRLQAAVTALPPGRGNATRPLIIERRRGGPPDYFGPGGLAPAPAPPRRVCSWSAAVDPVCVLWPG